MTTLREPTTIIIVYSRKFSPTIINNCQPYYNIINTNKNKKGVEKSHHKASNPGDLVQRLRSCGWFECTFVCIATMLTTLHEINRLFMSSGKIALGPQVLDLKGSICRHWHIDINVFVGNWLLVLSVIGGLFNPPPPPLSPIETNYSDAPAWRAVIISFNLQQNTNMSC